MVKSALIFGISKIYFKKVLGTQKVNKLRKNRVGH